MKLMTMFIGLAIAAASVSAGAQTTPKKGAPPQDPQLVECTKKNSELSKQLHTRYDYARKQGWISPKEESEFKRKEVEVGGLIIKLGKDGISLADCHAIGKALEGEYAVVFNIANLRTEMAECEKRNQTLVRDNEHLFNTAKQTGKINAREDAQYKKFKDDSINHARALLKDGPSLSACRTMTKDYEYIQAQVAKMAADAK